MKLLVSARHLTPETVTRMTYLIRQLKTPVSKLPVMSWLPPKLLFCGHDGSLWENDNIRFKKFDPEIVLERRITSFEWSEDPSFHWKIFMVGRMVGCFAQVDVVLKYLSCRSSGLG